MILLVDDDVEIRQLVAQVLESKGYQVVQASTGVEALLTFEAQPQAFELLITDLEMPGLDGPDLVKLIQRIWPALPVLFMTGSGLRPGRTVAKPFTAQDLLLEVEETLRSQSSKGASESS